LDLPRLSFHRHAHPRSVRPFPTRRSSDLHRMRVASRRMRSALTIFRASFPKKDFKEIDRDVRKVTRALGEARDLDVQLEVVQERSEEHTSELQSRENLVCRLLLEKKKDTH